MVQEMQEKDDAALREQVIRMAQEAGLMDWNGQCVLTDGQLERFFHLAAAAGAEAEREACARVVEDVEPSLNPIINIANRLAAAAIRARSKE